MHCYSQNHPLQPLNSVPWNILYNKAQIVQTDSGYYIIQITKIGCKNYLSEAHFYPNPTAPVVFQKMKEVVKAEHISLLKITGNILYDLNYRSRVDTPFGENNLYQHTLQTRLNIVYKDQYPFNIYLTTRFSNSSLFRKYTDLSLQFNQADFTRMLKKRLTDAVQSFISSKIRQLDSLKRQIDMKKMSIAAIGQSLQKPDVSQKLVEEREKIFFSNDVRKKSIDTSKNYSGIENQTFLAGKIETTKISLQNKVDGEIKKTDSIASRYYSYRDSVENKKRRLDSLLVELGKLEKTYKELRSVQQMNLADVKKEIESAKDASYLTKKIKELKIPDTLLPKGYKTLLAIQSFNIGRSIVNYSELSVKNISITGLQVEYNPHYYYAFAAGKVDYRFRDYIIPGNIHSHQYVALARFGKGMKNGNHLIFTYYTGRRQFYNSSITSSSNHSIPEYNLAGMTLEGQYKITRNIALIAEIAKSSIPYYSLDSVGQKGWMSSVTQFKNRTNEAFSIKLNSYFPRTHTRLNGSYKYIGANFQSFSTFTTGASQKNWIGRIEQPFFKKKLTVISSLQQNDYVNPFVSTAYKSSSILASVQANLRIKKWPVLTLGYYPSYQLTKINDNSFSESRYYTLVATSGYYYNFKGTQMSSYLVYSQFYNQTSDSGFIYFNSKNILFSQTANWKRLSGLMNLSYSSNIGYNIYTIENSYQFAVSKIITVGGGLKVINQTDVGPLKWGYSGNLTLRIRKLGDLQLIFDKGFIPGINKQLVENKLGRLTYFKTF